MLCAYWGFVFMSLHLGLHWNTMMGMARRMVKKPSPARTWILRILAVLIAGYGTFAFFKRDMGDYMLLRTMFVFFDFNEPLAFFLLDYIAAMCAFVWIGYYISRVMKIRR